MYKVGICEDEQALRDTLAEACRDILTRMEVEYELSTFSCAEEVRRALMGGARFDLLCLDILMPGQNGMELAREIRRHDERVSLLFITSSTDFLREGYSVRPIQYLLKPVGMKELEAAVRIDLRLHHQPQTIPLQAGGKTVVFRLRDILYIEGRDHGIYVFTDEGERFLRLGLQKVEKQLPADKFCRCHRSFIVNLAQIQGVFSQEVLMAGNRRIPMGRCYLKQFRKQFNAYLNAGNI